MNSHWLSVTLHTLLHRVLQYMSINICFFTLKRFEYILFLHNHLEDTVIKKEPGKTGIDVSILLHFSSSNICRCCLLAQPKWISYNRLGGRIDWLLFSFESLILKHIKTTCFTPNIWII